MVLRCAIVVISFTFLLFRRLLAIIVVLVVFVVDDDDDDNNLNCFIFCMVAPLFLQSSSFIYVRRYHLQQAQLVPLWLGRSSTSQSAAVDSLLTSAKTSILLLLSSYIFNIPNFCFSYSKLVNQYSMAVAVVRTELASK